MEREAFLYVKAKLLNSSIANRKNFGSGEVHFNLTGTYMNDPFSFPRQTRRQELACPRQGAEAPVGVTLEVTPRKQPKKLPGPPVPSAPLNVRPTDWGHGSRSTWTV